MKNINVKKILLISITGFVLVNSTACNNKLETIDVTNQGNEKEKIVDTDTNSGGVNSTEVVQNSETESQIIKGQLSPENYNEEDVKAYFNDTKEEINNMPNDIISKEKIINKFTILTDFIFYDTDIGGIKFNDLTEGVKQQVLDIYYQIDSIICNKYPNYKDTIGSKYQIAKNWLSNKYNQGREEINENLSTETKDNLNEAKEDIKNVTNTTKDVIVDTYDNAKIKVKNWYENLRNNY